MGWRCLVRRCTYTGMAYEHSPSKSVNAMCLNVLLCFVSLRFFLSRHSSLFFFSFLHSSFLCSDNKPCHKSTDAFNIRMLTVCSQR